MSSTSFQQGVCFPGHARKELAVELVIFSIVLTVMIFVSYRVGWGDGYLAGKAECEELRRRFGGKE